MATRLAVSYPQTIALWASLGLNHMGAVNHLLMFVLLCWREAGLLFDHDNGLRVVPLSLPMTDHTCVDIELQSIYKREK